MNWQLLFCCSWMRFDSTKKLAQKQRWRLQTTFPVINIYSKIIRIIATIKCYNLSIKFAISILRTNYDVSQIAMKWQHLLKAPTKASAWPPLHIIHKKKIINFEECHYSINKLI